MTTPVDQLPALSQLSLGELLACETSAGAAASITPDVIAAAIIGGENILKYGADPTGATSSTAALTAARAAGSVVYFPEGTYNFTDHTATDLNSDLIMIGAGRELVTIQAPPGVIWWSQNATGVAFKMQGMHVDGGHRVIGWKLGFGGPITLKDCRFTGQTVSVVRGPSGVRGTGVDVEIDGCMFEDMCKNGDPDMFAGPLQLTLESSEYVRITNNTFRNIGDSLCTQTIQAIRVGYPHDDPTMPTSGQVTITNNTFYNIRTAGTAQMNCNAISIQCRTAVVSHNNIRDVITEDVTNQDNEAIYLKTQHSIVSNNVILNSGGNEGTIMVKGEPLEGTPTDSPYSYAHTITNNVIKVEAGHRDGFVTRGINCFTGHANISGNYVEGVQNSALRASGINIMMANNTVVRSIQSDDGNNNIGIQVSEGNTVITGNRVFTLKGTNPCYGIYVNPGAASQYVKVSDNVVDDINTTGNGYGIYIDMASNACDALAVTNNHVTNVVGYAYRLRDSENTEMVVGGNAERGSSLGPFFSNSTVGVGTCKGYIPDGLATAASNADFLDDSSTINCYGKALGKTAMNTDTNTLYMAMGTERTSVWQALNDDQDTLTPI